MGSINVQVVSSSGRGTKARVSGKCNGTLGGYTDQIYTDNNGRAMLSWHSNTYLETIFIDGKAHRGQFRSGGSYSFPKR